MGRGWLQDIPTLCLQHTLISFSLPSPKSWAFGSSGSFVRLFFLVASGSWLPKKKTLGFLLLAGLVSIFATQALIIVGGR